MTKIMILQQFYGYTCMVHVCLSSGTILKTLNWLISAHITIGYNTDIAGDLNSCFRLALCHKPTDAGLEENKSDMFTI